MRGLEPDLLADSRTERRWSRPPDSQSRRRASRSPRRRRGRVLALLQSRACGGQAAMCEPLRRLRVLFCYVPMCAWAGGLWAVDCSNTGDGLTGGCGLQTSFPGNAAR